MNHHVHRSVGVLTRAHTIWLVRGVARTLPLSSILFLSLLYSPFHPTLSFPFLSVLLEVGFPKIRLGGRGSAVSSLSGVWGEAPGEMEFDAF